MICLSFSVFLPTLTDPLVSPLSFKVYLIFASVFVSFSVQMFCRFSFSSLLSVPDGSGYDSPEPFLTDGGPESNAGGAVLLAALAPLLLGPVFGL